MNILDNTEGIAQIDKGSMCSSILKLPEQIDQAWIEIGKMDIPPDYMRANHIVVTGMGGSALAGRIIDSLFSNSIKSSIEVITDMTLPDYIDEDTLVIISSYSGNTQETLAAGEFACQKGAKIFGITTGGKMKECLIAKGKPAYIFDPINNPSNQPRMSLGYSISAIIAVLAKLEYINLPESKIKELILFVGEMVSENKPEVLSKTNMAKEIALRLKNKCPVILASGHLLGSIHAFKNQLNENAKTYANIFDIPEANHHLMEGLRNPAQIKEFLHFMFVESDLYPTNVQIRYPLTREVVEKNQIETSIYKMVGKTELEQVFELLVLGSFISFYLAILYGIDPSPIPWVDYFKLKLK